MGTATPLGSCERIDTSGVYELSGNVTGPAGGTCIAINASNVTLDGNGHTVDGNGSTVAIGVVRANRSNVTVGNLTVIGRDGVDLNTTANATVANLRGSVTGTVLNLYRSSDAVVRDVAVETEYDGLNLYESEGAVVENASVHRTATYGINAGGITASQTTDTRLTEVATTGGFFTGLAVENGQNVTIRGATVRNVTIGLGASFTDRMTVHDATVDASTVGVDTIRATRVDVRNVTIERASEPLRLRPSNAQSGTVESGTFERVRIRAPAPGSDGAVTYAAVDGSNSLALRNLSTPTGTVTLATAANVSVRSVGQTPPAPANATAGENTVNLTADGANATGLVAVHYGFDVRESTVDLYRADRANGTWTQLPDANVTRFPVQNALLTNVTEPTAAAAGGDQFGVFGDPPTIDDCTAIESAGVYQVTGDLAGNVSQDGACIAVNASDVTIDGNGHELVGNDSGAGIRPAKLGFVSRADVKNLTVRNLSIRNVTDGVRAEGVPGVTVRNVTATVVNSGSATGVDVAGAPAPVVRDVRLEGGATGLNVRSTERARVTNVTLRPGRLAFTGVDGFEANDTVMTDLGVSGYSSGLSLSGARNVTLRATAIEEVERGLTATEVRNLTVADVRIDATLTSLLFRPFFGGTAVRETATLSNVTVAGLQPGQPGLQSYLYVDASSDVTASLTTPNATVTLAAQNVSATRVTPTPPAPADATLGRVNLTETGANATATVVVSYDDVGIDESTVELYRADPANDTWRAVPDANVTLDTANDVVVTTASDEFGTYGVFAQSLTIGGCTRIESAGTYSLTGDLAANATGPCVSVNASDVTIDGNGHTLTGNFSGTGIATVRSGLSNVTVRNITVRRYSQGIDLTESVDATVANATVTQTGIDPGVTLVRATRPTVTNVTVEPFSDGLELDGSDDARVRDVAVRATSAGGVAVSAVGAGNATLSSLTAVGPYVTGLDATDGRNVSIRSSTLDDATTGLDASGVRNVSVVGLSVRNATTAVTIVPTTGGGVAVRESGTVDVTVARPRTGPFGGAPAYLRLDGANDVLATLQTPNATARVSGANVSVRPVGQTPPAPTTVTAGRVNLSRSGATASATLTVAYGASLNDSTVSLYRVDPVNGSWTALDNATATVDPPTNTVTTTVTGEMGTYGVFGGNGSLPLGERLFPNGLPASSTGDPPTDVDGDGVLEDMDGDGRFGFTDVIEFVFSQQRGNYAGLSQQQVDALDLDGNGRITFVDVIDLVFELQGN